MLLLVPSFILFFELINLTYLFQATRNRTTSCRAVSRGGQAAGRDSLEESHDTVPDTARAIVPPVLYPVRRDQYYDSAVSLKMQLNFLMVLKHSNIY
jgi:hypothetical protein